MSSVVFTTADPDTQENTARLFELLDVSVWDLGKEKRAELSQRLKGGIDLRATADSDSLGFICTYTLLIIAAKNNHRIAVNRLLDAGSDINATCANGHTALYYACANDGSETLPAGMSGAQRLLERGPDIEIIGSKDRRGPRNALYGALEHADEFIIDLMLAAGASLPAALAMHAGEPGHIDDATKDYCARYSDVWTSKLKRFIDGTYTPSTREDWNHLASVIPLEDPLHPPKVAVRLQMLHDMRPDISLGGTRQKAVRLHAQGAGL